MWSLNRWKSFCHSCRMVNKLKKGVWNIWFCSRLSWIYWDQYLKTRSIISLLAVKTLYIIVTKSSNQMLNGHNTDSKWKTVAGLMSWFLTTQFQLHPILDHLLGNISRTLLRTTIIFSLHLSKLPENPWWFQHELFCW